MFGKWIAWSTASRKIPRMIAVVNGTIFLSDAEAPGTDMLFANENCIADAVDDVAECALRTIGKANCYRDFLAALMRAEGADVAVAEIDRLIEAVQMVREHKWVGRYEIKGGQVESASAGRCADAWMETAGP